MRGALQHLGGRQRSRRTILANCLAPVQSRRHSSTPKVATGIRRRRVDVAGLWRPSSVPAKRAARQRRQRMAQEVAAAPVRRRCIRCAALSPEPPIRFDLRVQHEPALFEHRGFGGDVIEPSGLESGDLAGPATEPSANSAASSLGPFGAELFQGARCDPAGSPCASGSRAGGELRARLQPARLRSSRRLPVGCAWGRQAAGRARAARWRRARPPPARGPDCAGWLAAARPRDDTRAASAGIRRGSASNLHTARAAHSGWETSMWSLWSLR